MISFKLIKNNSTINDVYKHLMRCDRDFIPNLSSYVDINLYSKKLFSKAERFEIWQNNTLFGLLAAYINKNEKYIYISNLSLEKEIRGKDLGVKLLNKMIRDLKKEYPIIRFIRLEVRQENTVAIKFYKKMGFSYKQKKNNKIFIYEKTI